jgi:hypothetical protein
MLSFLFIQKNTDWTQFQSETSIIPACELCMHISQNLRENSSYELIPENGTECANPNTTNKYCQAIKNITIDIKNHFGSKVPRFACGVIGPCVPVSIPNFTGEFCYQCRFLQLLASGVKKKKKSFFIKSFCSTSRNVFSGFCQRIEEEEGRRSNSFYNIIDSSKSDIPGAVCASYCRRKVKSKQRSSSSSSSSSRYQRGRDEL